MSNLQLFNKFLAKLLYFSMIVGGMDIDDYLGSGYTLETFEKLLVVEIPILLKITLPTGKFKAALFADPDIMIKVGDYTYHSEFDGTEIPGSETVTVDVYFKRPYFGLALGGEIDIPVSEKMFFIVDVRYVIMFSSIFDEDIFGENDSSMNSLKFMAGIGMSM